MGAPEDLRAWRGQRTLREAADLVGCDPSYLSLLENRKKKPSDRRLSLRLERVAGIPPEAWDEDDAPEGMLDDTLTAVNSRAESDDHRLDEGVEPATAGNVPCSNQRGVP